MPIVSLLAAEQRVGVAKGTAEAKTETYLVGGGRDGDDPLLRGSGRLVDELVIVDRLLGAGRGGGDEFSQVVHDHPFMRGQRVEPLVHRSHSRLAVHVRSSYGRMAPDFAGCSGRSALVLPRRHFCPKSDALEIEVNPLSMQLARVEGEAK